MRFSMPAGASWRGTKFRRRSASCRRSRSARQVSSRGRMHNVIVTGGSRGIGLGIAKKLAGAGYRVVAIARQPSDVLAAAIKEAADGSLAFQPFDLAEIDRIPDLVRRVRKEFGAIYGLVNNAGIGTSG